MTTAGSNPSLPLPSRLLRGLGKAAWHGLLEIGSFLRFLGGLCHLFAQTIRWTARGILRPDTKFRFGAVATQMIRVGVRSVPIIVLVQVFIGIILALQLAPTLQTYGQIERVADVVGIAVFRELGPLITAIVLSGFAGASIAAEIGSMVESEEIKALRAMALDPVHFLVVPRFLATVIMLTALAVLADVVGTAGGMLTATTILGLSPETYLEYTRLALRMQDFFTGLFKAGVFGVLISLIACWEGLSVSGGAEGVGRATTQTVVKSIVALIATDCLFTAVFYAFNI